MNISRFVVASGALLSLSIGSANAGWHYGLGWKLSGHADQAKVSYQSAINNQAINLDRDIGTQDAQDIVDNALNLNFYATSKTWTINADFASRKGAGSQIAVSNTLGSVTTEIKQSHFKFTTGPSFVRYKNVNAYAVAGLKANKFDFESKWTAGSDKIDKSWTELLVGAKADFGITKNIALHVEGLAGFGGADASVEASAAVNYRFSRRWSLKAEAKVAQLELTDGNVGDAGYFNIENNHTSASLQIIRIW